MTPEQKAAYVIAQSVEAFGKLVGMYSENMNAMNKGLSLPHLPDDFYKVIIDQGLYHNALMSFFHGD